jgi:hypothetical protein
VIAETVLISRLGCTLCVEDQVDNCGRNKTDRGQFPPVRDLESSRYRYHRWEVGGTHNSDSLDITRGLFTSPFDGGFH